MREAISLILKLWYNWELQPLVSFHASHSWNTHYCSTALYLKNTHCSSQTNNVTERTAVSEFRSRMTWSRDTVHKMLTSLPCVPAGYYCLGSSPGRPTCVIPWSLLQFSVRFRVCHVVYTAVVIGCSRIISGDVLLFYTSMEHLMRGCLWWWDKLWSAGGCLSVICWTEVLY